MDAPFCQALFLCSGITGGDCSHTSGLSVRREAAGLDGICWPTPVHLRGLEGPVAGEG
jgi:hypothetical protein